VFAMCSATDSFDIALAADGSNIRRTQCLDDAQELSFLTLTLIMYFQLDKFRLSENHFAFTMFCFKKSNPYKI